MKSFKTVQFAAIIASIVLLSACGRGPAYGIHSEQISKPLYAYNFPDQIWDQFPVNPSTAPNPAPTLTPQLVNTLPSLADYCDIHHCTSISKKLPIKIWDYYIRVPMPLPAPPAHSQLVFDNKVYEVVGISNRKPSPDIMIQPIGELQDHFH